MKQKIHISNKHHGWYVIHEVVLYNQVEIYVHPPVSTHLKMSCVFFTLQQTLRLRMDITHTEGGRNILIVANFVQQFEDIPGTDAAFSSNITFFATAPSTLHVKLRYRLICTPGTCSRDCSQTSGCRGFSQACVLDCNATVPCLNGGTCEVN